MNKTESPPVIPTPEECSSGRRVCYVCTWNHLGGTETLIVRHLRWLRENGHAGLVVSPRGQMSDAFRESASCFVELTEAQADSSSMNPDELDARNVQIANALGRDAPCHFVVFNLEGLHMAAEFCGLIKGSVVSVYLVFDDIFGPVRMHILEKMDAQGMVFAMNEGCLDGHRRRYGYKLEKSSLVPLPVVVPFASPPRSEQGECTVLTVARLVDMKGYIEGLIRDFAEIAKETRSPCKLVIIGDGPLRARLQRVASKTGIGDRIKFVGSVPYDRLPAFYAQAHVYVGMGTTVLEAAAAGLPVIIATAHTRDFITPGLFGPDTGLGLGEPYCGIKQLSGRELLRKLIDSPSERVSAGRVARDKVAADFEQEAVMRRFLGQLRFHAVPTERFPRPVQSVPFSWLRKRVKRFFGYHPLVMRFGRMATSFFAKSAILIRTIRGQS